MHTPAEINAAIARGASVTATAADLPRRGQPNRGAEVRVTQAFDYVGHDRMSVRAAGYKTRFAVRDVLIEGVAPETAPDHY